MGDEQRSQTHVITVGLVPIVPTETYAYDFQYGATHIIDSFSMKLIVLWPIYK